MKERKPSPVFFRMDGICAVSLLYAVQDRLSEIRGQETGRKILQCQRETPFQGLEAGERSLQSPFGAQRKHHRGDSAQVCAQPITFMLF